MNRRWAAILSVAVASIQIGERRALAQVQDNEGQVVIRGTVKNRRGRPVSDAVVSVVGAPRRTISDEEGGFRLSIAPGIYDLRVQADFYRPVRFRAVRADAADVELAAVLDDEPVEELDAVMADLERASAEAQLEIRKGAAGATDAVGAFEIAKSPDRNAGDAVRRVVGASLVDGRYLYVRGLGDRYTNARLNGAPLPSPEPDRQSVPLDMFPTLVLGDLTIHKTFTPDMPGDFAGGSLDIHTREAPKKWTEIVTFGLGANTQTTFARGLTYKGGATDFLGIDDGGRKLPKNTPKVTRLLPDGTLNPNLNAQGEALSTRMDIDRALVLPHGTVSGVLGNTFSLGKERTVAFLVGAGYTRRSQLRSDELLRTYGLDAQRPGSLLRYNDYRVETAADYVTWSALGSATLSLDTKNRIALHTLYSRSAEKETREVAGFNDEQATDIRDQRLRFVQRGLAYAQLKGEHELKTKTRLEWSLLQARATLDDPDLRETVYARDSERGFVFREGTQSGQHFFAEQGETTRSIGIDVAQGLGTEPSHSAEDTRAVEKKEPGGPTLKGGFLATLRGRSFYSRRFRFLRNPSAPQEIFAEPPGSLFRRENVGSAIELEEWTRPTDTYAARNDVLAGYAMVSLRPLPKLRAVIGQRLESSNQSVDSFDPFAGNGGAAHVARSNADWLPALQLTYELNDKTNLRAGASRTVARPLLRELAPFVFSDFFGAREILGNPKLERTSISNFDARLEYFPKSGEVFALSVFGKHFSKPIEPIIIPTSRGVVSFGNASSAVNLGAELEMKKRLASLWKKLEDFSVLANLTLVYSAVDLSGQAGIQTSTSRPLAGQSPYVANLAIDWEHGKSRARLLYNTFGRRVAQVGQNGLPDVYEEGRHHLDASFAQGLGTNIDLKFTVENILNTPTRFTQGAELTQRFTTGQSAWVALTISN